MWWSTALFLSLLPAVEVAAAEAPAQPLNAEPSSTLAAPPHILFIVVDDHGYSDCGYTGRSFIRTPTIDSFASEGVVLENMYVQKVCMAIEKESSLGSHFDYFFPRTHLQSH